VATRELNDLLMYMQSTAQGAQQKIDEMQLQKLHSVINAGQHGQPDSLSLECQLPTTDGGQKKYEFLRVSLTSLCASESLQIKEISLEFACDVKKEKPKRSDFVSRYVITHRGKECAEKEHCHDFKVASGIDSDFQAQASIDTLPLEDYLLELDETSNRAQKQPSIKNHLFRGLLFLLFLILTDFALLFFTNT